MTHSTDIDKVNEAYYYQGMLHGEQIIAEQIKLWADEGLTVDEILQHLKEVGLI